MDTKATKKSKATTEGKKKPKSSRNTEKRRERSKMAARCRRGKESEIFTDLSNCLPLSESTRSTLDKASVMRLSLCDFKLKEMIDSFEELKESNPVVKNESDESFDSLINNAMSGFVVVCSNDGDVIYASEGIQTCLGLSQFEVMGQTLQEFCHPCDQGDVKEMLVCNSKSPAVESRSALFRMKSANSTRGRNVHHRTTNYKVVSCFGRIFSSAVANGNGELKKWFVGICEPLLHPSDVDIPLNKQTFLSKHTPDMKFDYVDESISEVLGYQPEDMVGHSLFDFYHAYDGDAIARSFKSLYTKGQTVTDRSRFLAKNGGWIWVVTQATIIDNSAGKPTSVVCIHFVTSGVENKTEILSQIQLPSANEKNIPVATPTIIAPVAKKPLHETTNIQKCHLPTIPMATPVSAVAIASEPLMVNPFTGPIVSKPTPSTAKIFAPRTEDMDTGFLMPVNDMLIVCKEEPEDLTHLAPIAGDECIPLSNVPLLDDLLQWLDAADMEYTVLEGYEEPFPLPLIASTDTLPLSMTMCPTSEMVVKDDVILDSMPSRSPNCDSPLLLRCTDSTLLASPDPMLLSPFKTPSPDPSSSMDIMNTDIYDYSKTRCGGGITSSSDKCKDGGVEDVYAGFPMVTDFQEHLFSPSGSLDDTGHSPCPEQSLIIDRGGGGGKLGVKLDGGNPCGQLFEMISKTAGINVGKLKYVAGANPDSCQEPSAGLPPIEVERPPPNKLLKPSFVEVGNKDWHQQVNIAPPQPPWKIVMTVPNGSSSQSSSRKTVLVTHKSTRKRSNSTTIGTQTIPNANQANNYRYQHLVLSPFVLQALMNGTLKGASAFNTSNSGRKRNFLGKLLHGGSMCADSIGGESSLEKSSLVELTNQDCEVNAPLNAPLLDGPELLTALDIAGSTADCM